MVGSLRHRRTHGGGALKLSENAERLGEGLGRLQFGPANLGASFDIEYARFPIADQITAHLAYASALIASDQFQQASDILDRLPADHPETGYVRACLATKTQRWPDVLTAVGCALKPTRRVFGAGGKPARGLGSSQSGIDAACLTSRTAGH